MMVDESNTQENDRTDDEQAEQSEEHEAILTEEQLEIQREIESYQSKIGALDDKLNEFKDEYIESMKRSEMKEAHYTDSQIERYLSHIQGETIDEIRASVFELTKEIPVSDPFGDPSAFNGAKQNPVAADHSE